MADDSRDDSGDDPRSILITGASSGIGAALAILYAAPGITMALGGRDAGRLAAVADACRAKGASADWVSIDVTDAEAVAAWVMSADQAAPLDLVIANAGIGSSAEREPGHNEIRVFTVNVDGVLSTILPAAQRIRSRQPNARGHRGQIAIMSSLASFRGFAYAPAYCASKAAIRVFGEGMRAALAGEGIAVSVICPGYITTPMTAANPFPMPFLMDVERAARIIRTGLSRRRGRIAFPWPMYAAVWLLAALPDRLADWIMRRVGY